MELIKEKIIDWHFDDKADFSKIIVFCSNFGLGTMQNCLIYNSKPITRDDNFFKGTISNILFKNKLLYFYPLVSNSLVPIADTNIYIREALDRSSYESLYKSANDWINKNVNEKHEYYYLLSHTYFSPDYKEYLKT